MSALPRPPPSSAISVCISVKFAVVITHNHARSAQFVDEIEMLSALVERDMGAVLRRVLTS